MKIVSVKKPQWQEDGLTINCTIELEGGEELPYSVTPDDPEPFGQQLYADLLSGLHGEVADARVPSPLEVYEAARQEVLTNRKIEYRSLCDPLKAEADFDRTPEAEEKWRCAVCEVKARWPWPKKPEGVQ